MTPRAPAMAPDERRASIIEATLPLLREKGRAVSTRDIAEAAGIAEGTIFRAFGSKDEIISAALRAAFEPGPVLSRLAAVDVTLPLRDRLVEVVRIVQQRFTDVFSLMTAVGMLEPPDEHLDRHSRSAKSWREQVLLRMVEIIGEDQVQLTVSAHELTRYLRLLTFSGSHPEITDHELLTPEEIVDVLLYGVLMRPGGEG